MAKEARQSIAGWRNEALSLPIRVVGLDLTGKVLRGQVRFAPGTPGAPYLDLVTVTNGNAEGLRLVSVSVDTGVPTSNLILRINKTSMQGLPAAGELGAPTTLAYAIQLDGVTRLWGDFIVLDSAIDSDANAAGRLPGSGSPSLVGGTADRLTLTIGNDGVTVRIESIDALVPLVGAAQAAANGAAGSLLSAQQERAIATAQAAIAQAGASDAGSYLAAVHQLLTGNPTAAQLTLQATSRAVLAGFTGMTAGRQAWLGEADCYGLFTWSTANCSAIVAGDTRQALAVAPASDATGASGAWLRRRAPGIYPLRWYRAVADGVTNNTAAVTAWLAHLSAAYNAEGLLPAGTIVWDGGGLEPFTDNQKGFATITLTGVDAPSMEFGTIVPDPNRILQMSQAGSILRTFSTVNDCFKVKPNGGDFSLVKLVTRGVCFRTYDNPKVSGLHAGWAVQVDFADTVADTGVYSAARASQPTTETATGIVTPYIQNAAFTMLRSCVASGYYVGVEVNEHTDADGLVLAGNWIGRKFRSAYHSSRFGRVNVMRNHINVYFADETAPGRHVIVQGVENIERNTSFNPGGVPVDNNWTATQWDVFDMANGLWGALPWWIVRESTNEPVYDFKKAGGGRLHCYNLADGPIKKGALVLTGGVQVPSGQTQWLPFSLVGRPGLKVRAGDPTYIDVLEAGDYELDLVVELSGAAGMIASCAILLNGTGDDKRIGYDRDRAFDDGPVTLRASAPQIGLSAGDYLRVSAAQTGGGAPTIATSARANRLSARQLGIALA